MSNPTIEAKRLLGCAIRGIDRMEDDMSEGLATPSEGTAIPPLTIKELKRRKRRESGENVGTPKAANTGGDTRRRKRNEAAATIMLNCGVRVSLFITPLNLMAIHRDPTEWPWMDSLLRMFEAGPSANAISASTSLTGTPGAT